ncbi:HK97 family phage portal protein [Mycolicibacterium sp. BK634]|uniref:phage portal protein n=1 Tax=Mycolicibacterium sp. BK634 TaxID=2587099 RepID=UPI00160A3288|nr:phage portal protein [Mycolicibacterium sp. BK634]MBB3752600.1 HK97 family phage portal protein [Mycolicibacterium sp. BK634]
MALISRAFPGVEKRLADFGPATEIPSWAEVSALESGPRQGGRAASLSAFVACRRILCDGVATLPLRAFREKGEIRILSKPQPPLLQKTPYPGIVWRDWLWMVMNSLVVTGNAFLRVTARGPDNRPTSLLPLHPDAVKVEPDKELGWTVPIYKINGKITPAEDIVHIKRYPIAGSVVSLSVIEDCAVTFDLSDAANKYGLRWFRDSANPSGILSSDQDLTPTQIKQSQKNWILSHRGSRYPAMLGGGLKWQSLSITPEESQFLETRKFQRSEIAMLFGVPPHMIGDIEKQTSYGTGVEQQSIGFAVYTLRPWLECIEQILNTLLPGGQYVKFGIDALLRGDYKARQEGYQMAIQSGYLSVNEVRALEDREPIPGGDIHLQPMNFVPLGYVPPEPKAPTTPPAHGEKG